MVLSKFRLVQVSQRWLVVEASFDTLMSSDLLENNLENIVVLSVCGITLLLGKSQVE